jgi:aldose sugar dehydrogenase
MSPTERQMIALVTGICVVGLTACNVTTASAERPALQPPSTAVAQNQAEQVSPRSCELVESGYGVPGSVQVRVEEVASGLETPWGIGFLPDGSLLVSERAGRIRLVKNGQLQAAPVARIPAVDQGEGGLLGLVLHPNFSENRWFYVYYTTLKNGDRVNRVERWQLTENQQSATPDRIILDDIPVAQYHNGGRIRFGPDGMLYVGTGDARQPNLSQDPQSLAGKILRLTPEGEVPADNPLPGNPAYILGIRNTEGFDWLDASTLWVTDHGPSGELGLSGLDEVSLAKAGNNLGWPEISGCDRQGKLIQPLLSWKNAAPPGGAAVYTGTAIPEWRGSLLIGTLRSTHLQRVALNSIGKLERHEVYLQGGAPGGYGRLREVVMGNDNQLYVTTSNCDGRGDCPPEKDKILRITR